MTTAAASNFAITSLSEAVSPKSTPLHSNVSYSTAFPPQGETEFEFNSAFHGGFEARDSLSYDIYKSSLPANTKQEVQSPYTTLPVSPTLNSRQASMSHSECGEASQQLLGSPGMVFEDDDIQVHTSGSESHRQRNRTRRFRLVQSFVTIAIWIVR